MRVSITGRIGIALILVGSASLGSAIRWLAPHPHVALEMHVSLSPGHVITGNFSVHPGDLYYIDIELDKRSQMRAHCEPRSVLRTRWVLSSDGGAERGSSPWEDTGLTIADLYSGETRYAFDVEILPGASCLNTRNPRLKVQTHPYPSDLYVALTWLSIVPVGIGLALLMLPHISGRFSKIEETRMFPDMVLHNVLPITKHAPLVPIHGMPHWGLFCGAILWILMFIFMMLGPLPPHGLSVSLRSREVVVWDKSPWQETLGVYVRAPGRFFVNGEEIERGSLRTKLLEHLSRRVEWTVYFEADSDTLYMDDIYAIDTIQGCGAKLIWITPKMREEWRNKKQSSKGIL
jgi:biopolymer transport protein ExbD